MTIAVSAPPWSATNTYNFADVVTYNSVIYVCIEANTGATPGASPNQWSQIGTSYVGPSAVPVVSNLGTVAITSPKWNYTNTSAATMTINLATVGATDFQSLDIRIYDYSASAQHITWQNTENGGVSATTTSNGSTTLPITNEFQFNAATGKWRTILAIT